LQLAVSQTNKLYTWGISPQALRLSSQARKRAKAIQKVEEPVQQQQQPTTDEIKSEAELGKFEEVNIEVIKEECNRETGEQETKSAINPEIVITLAENKVETEIVPTDEIDIVKPVTVLQEQTDHLFPTLVDTSGVTGEISYVRSMQRRLLLNFVTYFICRYQPVCITLRWSIPRAICTRGAKTCRDS
jgi:hypothetical protein